MEFSDLATFAAVARRGSVTGAAGELHTVQSNVTARIRALEAACGTQLFARHSRGVALTAAGQRLLPYAERMLALAEEARRAVREDGVPRGPLRLGSMETTAALRMPPLLAAYAAAHPAVDLSLGTGTTAGLVEEVLSHRLDAAFVADPVGHLALAEEEAFVEELVLAAPAAWGGWEAAENPKLLVFRAGCSYRARLEALLAARGRGPGRLLEFGTLDGILGCVAAGIGITLLPRAVLGAGRPGIAVHSLPPTASRAVTVLVRRRDVQETAALRALRTALRGGEGRSAAA